MKKLLLLLLLLASRVDAQVPITELQLAPDSAATIAALYNAAGTTRLNGDSRIAPASEVNGNVAVLEGAITLGGHIAGDLLVINGDAIFEPGAHVDGTITIVGGAPRNVPNLTGARILWYRERLKYELRDGVLVVLREPGTGELAAGRQFSFGRTDMVVAARGGYNRSEGLPIYLGPRVTTLNKNPAVFEALFIFRTAAAFRFNEKDYGYALRAEQFVGGRGVARIGLRYASETLPIETWGLSDRENSLATLLLHEDHRDQYLRDGLSVYLASGRGGFPLEWRVAFGTYRYQTAPLRDPWTLTDNPDPWRAEPRIPGVHLNTLAAHLQYDTRNENRDPASGWLASGDVETSLSLVNGDASTFDEHFRYGMLDVRRYARLSPLSRLSLRAIVAGSIDGDPMPAFHQQALGGEGSLPGYALYQYDCRAHQSETAQLGQPPYYGCDRLALLQLEYQARFRWLSVVGRRIGRQFGLLENIRGVLFFDTGRAWSLPRSAGSRSPGASDFRADGGFGLRFGVLGAYWARPLSARANGFNFFVRVEPRI